MEAQTLHSIQNIRWFCAISYRLTAGLDSRLNVQSHSHLDCPSRETQSGTWKNIRHRFEKRSSEDLCSTLFGVCFLWDVGLSIHTQAWISRRQSIQMSRSPLLSDTVHWSLISNCISSLKLNLILCKRFPERNQKWETKSHSVSAWKKWLHTSLTPNLRTSISGLVISGKPE